MLSRYFAALVAVLVAASSSFAQFGPKEEAQTGGPRLDKSLTKKWQVGVKVRAVGGNVGALFGTIPVPSDWPEQQVKVVAEDVSPHVGSVTYRITDSGRAADGVQHSANPGQRHGQGPHHV